VKSDTVYKQTFNKVLDHLANFAPGTLLPSEKRVSDTFRVSRTTMHKVISGLGERGGISRGASGVTLSRKLRKSDYFPSAETVTISDRVEKQFMEWMPRGDRKPGDDSNGLELAREFKVSTSAIREYLNRFTRFGLIEKRPKAGWVFAASRLSSRSSFSRCASCSSCARRRHSRGRALMLRLRRIWRTSTGSFSCR
jgi:DNA-binding GntR family transcriptional regulator